jgi:hypothetical protein
MAARNLCAIYDFELLPYALGDVLTWNVGTAIRCEESGRARVDAHICVDERFPSSLFQRDLVTAENCGLFANELFGAFATHPRLGSLQLYRQREEMLERLRERSRDDPENASSVAGYERALAGRGDEASLIRYFTEQVHTHQAINAYAQRHGRIPLLRPSLGCEPDVEALITRRFAGKRIVTIHLRLIRLDAGYGGKHTHARDSDFLAWFEFLRRAEKERPDVQFVLLGRLQEKPLELLALANVVSLRTWGLGLGHELTLMLAGDLFIGTSSGFAAMANFSQLPYFITRMTPQSCKAYGIAAGAERLPFATERQILVYEPETPELLMRLLDRGLAGLPPRNGSPPTVDSAIDVRGWEWERHQWLHPGATTYRFFTGAAYADKETAFLVWPEVRQARAAWRSRAIDRAREVLTRIETAFPRMSGRFPEFLRLKRKLARASGEAGLEREIRSVLERLAADARRDATLLKRFARYLRWGHPLAMEIRNAWRRRHRIPRRLARMARRAASGSSGS